MGVVLKILVFALLVVPLLGLQYTYTVPVLPLLETSVPVLPELKTSVPRPYPPYPQPTNPLYPPYPQPTNPPYPPYPQPTNPPYPQPTNPPYPQPTNPPYPPYPQPTNPPYPQPTNPPYPQPTNPPYPQPTNPPYPQPTNPPYPPKPQPTRPPPHEPDVEIIICPEFCDFRYEPLCAIDRWGNRQDFYNSCRFTLERCRNPLAELQILDYGECRYIYNYIAL